MSNKLIDVRPDLAEWWDSERNYPAKLSNVTVGSSKRFWFTDPSDPAYTEKLRVKDFTRRKHPRRYIEPQTSDRPSTQEITGAPGSEGQDSSGRRMKNPEGMIGVTNIPKEPTPKMDFEVDGKDAGVFEVSNVNGPVTATMFEDFLEERGIDPKAYRIVDTLRTSEWETPFKDDNGDIQTKKLYAYKYRVERRTDVVEDFDELVESARRGADDALKAGRSQAKKRLSQVVRTLQVADLQIGKVENGGITQHDLIQRFFEGLRSFKDTIHDNQPVHVIFAGDCLEGNQSQGGRNDGFRTPLTITEQLRLYRRLLTETAVELAGVTSELTISVVGGNHDDANRKLGSKAGNNWATETAISVDDAIRTFSDAYSHVRILVPHEDKSWMTVDVAGSIWTIAHGHQWRRGKAADWWSSMCFYADNATGAHILAHGHEHTFSFRQEGARNIICSPTMDGGSDWFCQKTGAWQSPHGVAYDAVEGTVANVSLI